MSQVLLKKIDSIRRRAKRFVWMRAICLLIVTSILLIALLFQVDLIWQPESKWLRYLYSMASLFGVICLIAFWLRPASRYRPDDVEVARRIPTDSDEQADELSTAVTLARECQKAGRTPSSQESRLIQKVSKNLEHRTASSVVLADSPKRFGLMAVLCLVLCASIVWNSYSVVKFAATRMALPWKQLRLNPAEGGISWPRRGGDLDGTIPRGSSFGCQIQNDSSKQVRLEVQWDTPNGVRKEVFGPKYQSAPDSWTVPNVQHDFRVRGTAGMYKTTWRNIRVVSVPEVLEFSTTVMAPEGMGIEDQTYSDKIYVWPGSRMIWQFRLDSPVDLSKLELSVDPVLRHGQTYSASVVDQKENRYEVRLHRRKSIKLRNGGGSVYLVFRFDKDFDERLIERSYEVIENLPPKLELTAPEIAGQNSIVDWKAVAEDELGISSLELKVGDQEIVTVPMQRQFDPNAKVEWGTIRKSTVAESLDLQNVPNLWAGKTLIVEASCTDSQGFKTTTTQTTIKIVSPEELIASLKKKQLQLFKALEDLNRQQNVINSGMAELRDRIANQGTLDPLAVPGMISEQVRVSNLFQGDEFSTYELNVQLAKFYERHRIDGSGIQETDNALQLQGQAADQLSTLLEQTDVLRRALGSGNATNAFAQQQLQRIAQMQIKFQGLVSDATDQLRQLSNQATLMGAVEQLIIQQTQLQKQTSELNRRILEESAANLEASLSAVALQQQQLSRQINHLAIQLADEENQSPAAENALADFRSLKIGQQLTDVQVALSNQMAGLASMRQELVVKGLQQIAKTLSSYEEGSNKLSPSGSLSNQVQQLIEGLKQIESELDQFGDKVGGMDEQAAQQERQALNRKKQVAANQMRDFKNAVDASEFADLAEMIEQANEGIASSDESIEPDSLRKEADKIRDSIAQLQGVAIEMVARDEKPESAKTNFSETRDFLLQILAAQTTINRWSEEQRLLAIEAQSSNPAKLNQYAGLQTAAAESFIQVAESVGDSRTAALYVESIPDLQKRSADAIRASRFNDESKQLQAQIVWQMSQLIAAIEIQLAANQDNSEISSEENNEDSNEQTKSSGISSFDLTMLYVMQKNIHQESERLLGEIDQNGTETVLLRSRRLELAKLQGKVAIVLAEMLAESTESIPELPDF